MQAYREEAKRLREAKALLKNRFPRFGVNKKREIVRLIYEISKRDNIPPGLVLPERKFKTFSEIKTFLLQKRFPGSTCRPGELRPYLPRFSLSESGRLRLKKSAFNPRRIFIEERVLHSALAGSFRKAFPRAQTAEINTLKEYLKQKRRGDLASYNRRSETVFIVGEEYDFFKRCPCTKRSIPCGYHIFNLSFGCIYECTYCYLQEYINSPGLIFAANLDRFFDRFAAYHDSAPARAWQRGPYLRLGTGEFSDSLMLDDLTGYSPALVDFFNRQPGVIFEFKTKSSQIDNLLKIKPAGNIVVGWSLNPQSIIDDNEFYSASLKERLDSARRCSRAGYKVAFHFDPVIYRKGWKGEYEEVIENIFSRINPGDIAWISLGTLRFKPPLKKIIEARFPKNQILDEEMVIGYDGKLRYPEGIRYNIYKFLIRCFNRQARNLPLYLCMEEKKMWDELKLPFPFG